MDKGELMKLSTALRLKTSPRVAFVGAGGKTSGMFILARELLESPSAPNSVMVSTTTHLGLFQAANADCHIVIKDGHDLASLRDNFPNGLVMVTGEPAKSEKFRITGIPPEEMLALADIHHFPLLIEADGARMLPLKAPADYEPVIPSFVDTVVVLAGLSGIGKPLSNEWVHRPEKFAELSGLALGEKITPRALQDVLLHPLGGMKNIPSHSHRVVFLNQAEGDELQSTAYKMTPALLEKYHAVVIGSIFQPTEVGINNKGEGDLCSTSIHESYLDKKKDIFSVHESIAGVVLAGGEAHRFGQPKQLLVWQGQPLVRRAAVTALEAGLSPVIVVTGAVDEPIREALHGLNVQIVHNPNWKEGQSTSVKAGISVLPDHIGGVVFLLADQPRVTSNLIGALIEKHAWSLSPLVAPQVGGQRSTPVLFDREVFPELKKLSGDQGGRALFPRYEVAWIPWQDVGLTLDIDTPEDFRRLLEEDSG